MEQFLFTSVSLDCEVRLLPPYHQMSIIPMATFVQLRPSRSLYVKRFPLNDGALRRSGTLEENLKEFN